MKNKTRAIRSQYIRFQIHSFSTLATDTTRSKNQDFQSIKHFIGDIASSDRIVPQFIIEYLIIIVHALI